MAGGAFVDSNGGRDFEGKVTTFVLITCFVAAMGGLLFGYDLGITGGVTSMEIFLVKFFPSVYKQMKDDTGNTSQYCKFDSQLLTLFTSSLYLAALLASFVAASITRKFGRKPSMFIGGLFFLVGALLNGLALNVEMLIVGRILLGFGVGFCNQSVPVYLSEMAPSKIRGALNMGFQMMITIGILIANLINYGTSKHKHGWRISLGIGAVPAILLCVGTLCLDETPNSMIERGQHEKAKAMLQKIRGTSNIDEEYHDLVDASEEAKKIEHPWKNILQPKYRPHVTFCFFIPTFQQLTGINAIMFYAPIIIGIMIGMKFGLNGQGSFSKGEADLLLFFICLYVAAFAWSWGPLGWLVPTEICSLEIRPAGQAINVAVNMLFTFAIAQAFLTMLCHLKFGLFFFFAAFVVIMTIFIAFLLPETKNIPLEEMSSVWKSHWFWNKIVPNDIDLGGYNHKSNQKSIP
ncbi:unnamed protein product [Lupinus luteus]|uniref:Major facilitator superfamily (MFS) profile domain-containing protein n=1 Tax=Lupinus luteus TaxID=3873 RepID=A0AAV1XGU6_LUPLU